MADVKWIKLATDVFENRKVRQIENMPDGDSILVIWFKLLCLCGKTNDGGLVYFTSEMPYTDDMLATQFGRPISTVRLALSTFEKFGMVEIIDDMIYLSSWEKYQNAETLDKIRDQTRRRVAAHREKKRIEAGEMACNVTNSVTLPLHAVTVTECNAREEEREEEREEDIDIRTSPPENVRPSIDYNVIILSFNSICTSLPKVRDISDKRKRAVNAASKLVGDRFDELFRKVEASDFLSGRVKEWRSNFDWILKPANVTKILEGTYDNRSAKKVKTKAASFDLDEYAQVAENFVPIYKK